MQKAIPFISSNGQGEEAASSIVEGSGRLRRLVSVNTVLVFSRRGCFMCHVANRLLLGHGVKPIVYEVDQGEEVGLVEEITQVSNGDQRPQFPAVFIGGRLVGGLDRLMALHVSGELVPILKEAGALWL